MTDYIVTEIRPFVHMPEEFLTDEEKANAIDMKEFSNLKLSFMDSIGELNIKLNEKVFFMEVHGSRRHYRFSMQASILYSKVKKEPNISESMPTS